MTLNTYVIQNAESMRGPVYVSVGDRPVSALKKLADDRGWSHKATYRVVESGASLHGGGLVELDYKLVCTARLVV